MEINKDPRDCSGHDTFECIQYQFDYTGEDRDRLESLREEGEELASSSDGRRANDSANWRTADTQAKDGVAGIIAEWVWIDWLKRTVDDQDLDVKVNQYDDWDDPEDQVDITVERADGESVEVEVRASFPYTSLNNVICSEFDIIGWYNNDVKVREKPKDYYVRVLFPFAKSKFWDKFRSDSLNVHLTGGASREMLEDSPHATDGDFIPYWIDSASDQKGTYRIISPIVNAKDTLEITDDIIS